jgi:phosphoribosylformimino-5-aminoimidazole carboxamide ribonucleotide (ProFAR) isomerase
MATMSICAEGSGQVEVCGGLKARAQYRIVLNEGVHGAVLRALDQRLPDVTDRRN